MARVQVSRPFNDVMPGMSIATVILATLSLLSGAALADTAEVCLKRAQNWFDELIASPGWDDLCLFRPQSACGPVDGFGPSCLDEDHCSKLLSGSDTTCASGIYCCSGITTKHNPLGSSEIIVIPLGACWQECVDDLEPLRPDTPADSPTPTAPQPVMTTAPSDDEADEPSDDAFGNPMGSPSGGSGGSGSSTTGESSTSTPSPPASSPPSSPISSPSGSGDAGATGGVLAFALAMAAAVL